MKVLNIYDHDDGVLLGCYLTNDIIKMKHIINDLRRLINEEKVDEFEWREVFEKLCNKYGVQFIQMKIEEVDL